MSSHLNRTIARSTDLDINSPARTVNTMPSNRRGFTILEVLVALVLTTSMVLVMVRWVGLSGQLSANGAATAGNERTLLVVSSTMADDFENAQPCDGQRRSSMFAQASPSKLVLYRDVDNDGTLELVTWRLAGPDNTQLLREVSPTADDGCTAAPGVFESRLVTDRVRAGTTELFTPRVNGAELPLAATVSCGANPTLCNWQAVGVRMVLENSGGGQPLTLDEVFDLNWRTVRLPLTSVGSVRTTSGADAISSTTTQAMAAVGDFDVRANVQADDWSAGSEQVIVVREDTPTTGLSFKLALLGDGRPVLSVSSNGTSWQTFAASAAVPFADGVAGSVSAQFTHGFDNGLDAASVSFATSVNGVTWVPLGTPVGGPSRFRLYSPDVPVTIGALSDGTAAFVGEIFEVRMDGSSNAATNGWFNASATGVFADSWAGYSAPVAALNGNVSPGGGPSGDPYQRISWTAAGGQKGLVLTGGTPGDTATNCTSAATGPNTFCLWPDSVYLVSFQARGVGGGGLGAQLSAVPSAGAVDRTDINNPPMTDNWQQYEFAMTTTASFPSNALVLSTVGAVNAGSFDVAHVEVDLVHPGRTLTPAWQATPPSPDLDSRGELRNYFTFRASEVGAGSRTMVGDNGEVWTVPASAELTYS